jgi:hypothetical protein
MFHLNFSIKKSSKEVDGQPTTLAWRTEITVGFSKEMTQKQGPIKNYMRF